jgi:hypothetical protein
MSSSSRKYSNFYSAAAKNTEEDEDIYKHFVNTNNVQTVNLQNRYEGDRSKRHMEHYFDTSKFTTETISESDNKKQAPPSKAQLDYWKCKKEEKKKKKNEWLLS